MPLLIAGFSLVLAGVLGWSVAADFSWLQYQAQSIRPLSAVLLLIPALAAWTAAELVNLASPRRLFDRRRRTRVTRFSLGAVAGLLTAALGAVLLPVADRFVPDAAVFAGASLLVMTFLMPLCPRIRPGHCIHCGYDLRQSPAPGQPGAGRCPECGAEITSRTVERPIGGTPAVQVP